MDATHDRLLAAMLDDLEHAEPCFRPTHYWRLCSARLLDDLRRFGIERFRSTPAALMHFVPTWTLGGLHPEDDRYRALLGALDRALPGDRRARLALEQLVSGRTQALADYRVWRAAYRDALPFTEHAGESRAGDPVGQQTFDGRRYSRSMLNYLLGLELLKRHGDDVRVRTVLEIGGGFGTLGEILASDTRNESFYVDVDIPPTALFATWYLEQVLGADRVTRYDHTRDAGELRLEDLARPGAAAVLCPWQLPRLQGEVDLFVNFISFQEMEPPVVEGYLSHVRRLGARYVLLRNLREGKQVARGERQLGVLEPIRGEDYDRFLSDYELVARNVTPFGYETPDGFHSELRLYRLA